MCPLVVHEIVFLLLALLCDSHFQYRGYRDIGDFYNPVKIKRVVDLMSDYVEVDEVSRPKLSYDER